MRRLILAFAFIAPVIFLVLVWSAPWLSLGILALSHALVLYPTLRPNAQWLGPVFTSFDTAGREVWLTIDDGPAADTSALLDLLDSRGVRAGFFVKGVLAESSPELVREIARRGHAIGNHSQTHPSASFWCLPPTAVRREIERCSSVLQSLLGTTPTLFRAPVGMKNPFVHPVLRANGMRLIGWSCRAFDAVKNDVGGIVRSIESQLEPGSIVVLHQGRDWSLDAIEAVIASAQRKGYSFVVPDPGRLKTKR
jgi:peptidoglycan/xylan/chitin deacetylase (PgdA/CDA1 family)